MIQGKIVTSTPEPVVNEEFLDEEPIIANADAEPAEPIVDAEEDTETLKDQFSQLFNAFADALPNNADQKKGKRFFKAFASYFKSDKFEQDLEEKSEEYKIPKKQLAKNFFLKILGILGDILGIVINTVCNIANTLLMLLNKILTGAVSIVNKAANGLSRIITLNQTNLA